MFRITYYLRDLLPKLYVKVPSRQHPTKKSRYLSREMSIQLINYGYAHNTVIAESAGRDNLFESAP